MSTPADVTISDIQIQGNFQNIQQLRQQVKALQGSTASLGEAQHALELATMFMRNGYTKLACIVAATTGYTGDDNVIGLLNQGKRHLAAQWARSHSVAASPGPVETGGSNLYNANIPTWDTTGITFQALDPVHAYAAMLRDVGKKSKDDLFFPAGATVNQVNAVLQQMAQANGDSNPLTYGSFVDPPNNNPNTAHGPYDLPGWPADKPWVAVNPDAPDFGITPSQSTATANLNPLAAGAAGLAGGGTGVGSSASVSAAQSASSSSSSNKAQTQTPLPQSSTPTPLANMASDSNLMPGTGGSLTTGNSLSGNGYQPSTEFMAPENLIAGAPSVDDVNKNMALNVTDPTNQSQGSADKVIGNPQQPPEDMGMNFDPTPHDKLG